MEVLQRFTQEEALDDKFTWQTLPPMHVQARLVGVLGRPWWRRYWVVQEASLAREVIMMCGAEEIVWQNTCAKVVAFMTAIKLTVVHPQWREAGLAAIDLEALLSLLQMQLTSGPQRSIWSTRRQGSPDLLDLAFRTRHRQAHDPRDRFYSLLGLVSQDPATELQPDYTKPLEEVYDRFAQVVKTDAVRICNELRSLEAQESGQHDHAIVVDTISRTDADGKTLKFAAFIQRLCDRAVQDTKSSDYGKAAKMLSDAATLLRGETLRAGDLS